MSLTAELEQVLRNAGAKLVGIGDMKNVSECDYPVGIAVAVPLPVHIVEQIEDGPTKEYLDMYHELNGKLNEIVTAGAEFLKSKGYRVFAQTTDVVKQNDNWETEIPHKTVATRAGLGWIGKSCILVTKEYGSAIRLSSLFTDAPLECSEPYDKSQCGACSCCVDNCPAHALKGTLWERGMKREDIFSPELCDKTARKLTMERFGMEKTICGKCFVVCPYTRKYVKLEKEN